MLPSLVAARMFEGGPFFAVSSVLVTKDKYVSSVYLRSGSASIVDLYQ